MGGHGGLNILPQKRWNVYNFDNREKVRQDEEAAAREEQLKREQSRRRDAEFRLECLRQSRGLPSSSLPSSSSPTTVPAPASPSPPSPDSRHINLFDGLQGFSSLVGGSAPDDGTSTGSKKHRTQESEDGRSRNAKKQRKEEPPRTVTAEDEKYKLGYGLVGKGVKAPWYMSKAPALIPDEGDDGHRRSSAIANGPGTKNGSGKKTIEELREERMKREKLEKERARALLGSTAKKGADRGFSRRRY